MMDAILIDAHNLMYRSHYKAHYLVSEDNHPTGAIHGCLMAAAKYRVNYPQHQIVWLWDGPDHPVTKVRSWRYLEYPEYKGKRLKTDLERKLREDVHAQIRPLFSLLHYAGYLQYRVPGVEADDLAGIMTANLSKDVHMLIDTNDKDYYQLLQYPDVGILNGADDKPFEAAGLKDKWGVVPEQWPWYRALTGDSSDNIPGIKGIGDKRARALLDAGLNPELEYDDQPTKVHGKIRREQWGQLQRWEKLTNIVTSVDDPRLGEEQHTLKEQLQERVTSPVPNVPKFEQTAGKYDLVMALERRDIIVVGGADAANETI